MAVDFTNQVVILPCMLRLPNHRAWKREVSRFNVGSKA